MARGLRHNGWIIWATLIVGLLLSIAPMPGFMMIGRPLWLGMFLAYWALTVPHRVGLGTAWAFGLAQDVLYGNLLGLNALVLSLIIFLILALQQRLRAFPVWQQGAVLLVVFGLAQLLQLWLNTLTGNRPPMLIFLVPSLVSALLWPWIFLALRALRLRYHVH